MKVDITEDYKQKPSEYLTQLEQLTSKLSLQLTKTNPKLVDFNQLVRDITTIHDLSLKAKAIFDELYSKNSTRMFERIDDNKFKLITKI